MARGYKRLTRKARHLIRHLKRTKHASVQDQMIHELKHEVSRTHGFCGPKKGPKPGDAGHWRPLTRKAKHLLSRLRKAKVWSVQKQLVNELAKEIERGRRAVERVRERAQRVQARAKAAAARTRAGAERTGRTARSAARKTRNGWNRARPHAAKTGRKFRATISRGQERLLTRAERRQAQRGPRKPGRIRQSVRSARENARRRLRARKRPGRRPLPARAASRASRPARPARPARTPRTPRPQRARRAPRPARTR